MSTLDGSQGMAETTMLGKAEARTDRQPVQEAPPTGGLVAWLTGGRLAWGTVGGYWDYWGERVGDCRSAGRGGTWPDFRYWNVGFRVVLAPGQP